jgi:BirA family biotin operon repressor/biotin-[acetyl-CoA-carboxylase] ligase
VICARIHRYDTVESTNDIAIEMLRRGEPEGTMVTALAQSKGRGRRGRTWLDEPGQNVLMSLLLTPEKQPFELHELSFVTAVGVRNHLALDHGLEAVLKWPNDVLVGDKKIAGILIETTKFSDKWGVVAGIGLNINQSVFGDELSDCATSIALETGRRTSVEETCEVLASRILDNYEQYLECGFAAILAIWRKHMWGKGLNVELATEGKSVVGNIRGVDETGALLIVDGHRNQHIIRVAETIKVAPSP